MPKFEPEHYLSPTEYIEAVDLIVRNFIARTDMLIRAIGRLWEIEDYQDCWILYRCLLDRLFHLAYLAETGTFEVFDDWSFHEQSCAINRIRSDRTLKGVGQSKLFTLAPKEQERFRKLSLNPPAWRRPKVEDIAKKLNLRFLYKFGYDLASMHVHPMGNDGQQDFYTITNLSPSKEFPDQRAVLGNSILAGSVIIQDGLSASTFKWRALLFDFLSHLLDFLDKGDLRYKVDFLNLSKLFEEGIDLSQPV